MTKFAIAEHRQAYAGWCYMNGVKQNHAVFLTTPDRVAGLTITPEQIIMVSGWERSAEARALRLAVEAAVGRAYV